MLPPQLQGAGGPGGLGMAPGAQQGAAIAGQAQQAVAAGLAAANAALAQAQQQQAQMAAVAAAGMGAAGPVAGAGAGAGAAQQAGVILAADIMAFPPGTPQNVQQLALGPDIVVNLARNAITVTTLNAVTCATDGGANGGFTALYSQLIMLGGLALYTVDVHVLA